MGYLENITVIVVNYRTIDLAKRCIDSFLNYYPGINLLLIDNGSQDNSTEYIEHVSKYNDNVTSIINEENLYHGPAMDQGIKSSATRFAFTLDSDCEIIKQGFLEQMLALFQDPDLYAAGQLAYMDRYGYETRTGRQRNTIKYIYPFAMLLDKEKYLALTPFIHHGSPGIKNMHEAEEIGYTVMNFPVKDLCFEMRFSSEIAERIQRCF